MKHPVESYVRVMIELYNEGVSTGQLYILFPWESILIRRMVQAHGARRKKQTQKGKVYHFDYELLVRVLKRHGMVVEDLCDFKSVPQALEMNQILRRIKKRPRRGYQARQGAQPR